MHGIEHQLQNRSGAKGRQQRPHAYRPSQQYACQQRAALQYTLGHADGEPLQNPPDGNHQRIPRTAGQPRAHVNPLRHAHNHQRPQHHRHALQQIPGVRQGIQQGIKIHQIPHQQRIHDAAHTDGFLQQQIQRQYDGRYDLHRLAEGNGKAVGQAHAKAVPGGKTDVGLHHHVKVERANYHSHHHHEKACQERPVLLSQHVTALSLFFNFEYYIIQPFLLQAEVCNLADLETNVRYIKGIGEQRAKALEKLGITTLRDLIGWFPRKYDDRTQNRTIAELVPGEAACTAAMIAAPPTVSHIRRGMDLVKVRAVDATGVLDITFFNQTWLRDQLHQGETYLFFGKAEGTSRRRTMANPVVEPESRREVTGRIVPIYPLTAGVSQLILSRSIRQGLDACAGILPDVLPDEIRQAHHLCRIGYAYENIHFPESPEALDLARRRLAFEELFLFTIGLRRLRRRREVVSVPPCQDVDMTVFDQALPFSLTGAQRRCIEDALRDMRSGQPMNRLCQGDVGSGKTMVAAACAYFCVKNGRQAALMAPTEILARQHYAGLSPLLESLGVHCALLTGSTPAKARRSLTAQLESGEIDFLIGTHALITGSLTYRNLGLVVTDEQHRFGVAQRAALSAKGDHPHILVMSATPIPRTLALILYGDLDVSVIDELPPGRRPVETVAVSSGYAQRVYAFLRKLIAEGRQAYVVCPMVESHDEVPDERKAVTEYAKKLQAEIFPDLKVAFVHGKMKPAEKDAVMTAFAAGETDILVSTTVIEVGVDVPNATVIVIENAERFGLSQLHQLRGRVGRGSHQSYCVLISDSRSEETRARLKIMTRTTDGFRIAEEDLRLRGPGDFFGQRQHGLPGLKVADLGCDTKLLQEAQQAAEEVLRRDPELKQHPAIQSRMQLLFSQHEDAMN